MTMKGDRGRLSGKMDLLKIENYLVVVVVGGGDGVGMALWVG